MEERDNKFRYSYSAPTEEERREIESIRRAYQSEEKEPDRLDRLRALDGKVRKSAKIAALCLGVAGCLLFGWGMALVLEWNKFAWGIAFSAVGAALMVAAYPAYRKIFGRNKEKYGGEILRLSEELLNGKERDGRDDRRD